VDSALNFTVFQHEPAGGLGLLGHFISLRGGRIRRTITPAEFDSIEAKEIQDDFVVILGSRYSIHDVHLSWIRRERQLVRELLAYRTRMFGVCFGAQMIAAETGGEVFSLDTAKTIWESNDTVLSEVWRGPWFHWHSEQYKPSTESIQAAAMESGHVQAYLLPRAVGVQFHPEVDADILRAWNNPSESLESERRARLLEAIQFAQLHAEAVRRRSFALFDHIIGDLLRT
jgi:GMP synthase (glutamine-hydrolysing)